MKKLLTIFLTILFLFTVHAHAQESGTIEAQPGDSDYVHPLNQGIIPSRRYTLQKIEGELCRGGVADCYGSLNLYFVCVNDRWVTVHSCPF